MAANNVSLQIEVVSKNIDETTKKLNGLGFAAEENAKKVEKLTTNIQNLMDVQKQSASSSAAYSNMMWAIADAMNKISIAANQTAKDTKNLNDALQNMVSTNASLTRSFQSTVSGGGVVNTTLRAMATAASAYIGMNMAKGIVEASDGWQMMQAKLKIATGSMSDARAVQEDLFNLAQKMRAPLDDMGKLYTRISTPMEKMGKDSKQTMEQVEYLAASLKLAGATTAEASSVMLQYSQSVNSGKLQGGEFNAVSEASPGILRDIEKYLKSTGQMAEYGGMSLKEMASKGLITFEVLQKAAQMALPEIRKQMADLPETVDGAVARIKNAWFKAMGELGQDAGLGKNLNAALSVVEQSIPKIRDILVSAFTFIVNHLGEIKAALELMVAIKLVGFFADGALAVGRMIEAFTILEKGIVPVIKGITGATTAVEGLRLAAAALAGPWGILIAAIGTAAVLAYQKFSEEAPKAEKAVTGNVEYHVKSRVSMLQKEIDKYNERNAAAAGGNKPADKGDAMTSPEMDNALKRMLQYQKDYNDAVSKGQTAKAASIEIDLRAAQSDYERESSVQRQYLGYKKINDEAKRQGEIQGVTTKALEAHATKSQALAAELKKWEDQYAQWGSTMPDHVRKQIIDDMSDKSKSGEDPYAKLTANSKAQAEQLREEQMAQDGLTKSRILSIKMEQGAIPDYNKLTEAQKARVLSMVKENAATEEKMKADDEATKARQQAFEERVKFMQTTEQTTKGIQDQTLATRAQIIALTDGKAASKEITEAELLRKAAMADANAEAIRQQNMDGGYDSDARATALTKEAQAYRDQAAAVKELGVVQDNKSAIDAMNKALDPSKALQYGNGFASAFGKVGKAIDGAGKAMDQYGKKNKLLQAAKDKLDKMSNPAEKEAAENEYRKQSIRNEIDMYADMAGAAKGFFAEKTFAYKALSAFEQGLRIAQMALDYEQIMVRLGLQSLLSKSTEKDVIAAMALDGLQTETSIGNSEAKAAASGTAGIAKAFEQLGVWGFIGAAAIIAFLASIGVSAGGGGASMPSISEQRQKSQGTGSVLGDDNAKSNSASKALDGLKSNADISLKYSQQMLMYLRGIEDGISGMAAAVAQTSGLRTSSADELAAGVGSSHGFLGFSGSSKEIQDSGILFGKDQTAGSVRNSGTMAAQGYQDIHSESSSWWGLSSDSSDEENLKQLDSSLQRQMALTVNNFVDGLAAAGESLGKSGTDIKNQLNNFGLDLGHLSLKGLSGDDIQKQIEAVFSKMGDDMAKQVLPEFTSFQKVGEGYFQTVVRVANGYEQASVALQRMNIQVVALNDIANKQGDVAAEAVRDSLMKQEGYQHVSSFFNVSFQNFFKKMSGIGDIISTMDGSASDLIDTYKQLVDIRDQMKGANLSDDVNRSMVAGAGSVDALATGLSNYLKLLPKEQQAQVAQSKVSAEFARLGVQLPKSKQALADLIKGYMAGDAASQQFGASLMNLAGDYNDMYDTLQSNVDDAQSNLKDAYDNQKTSIDDLITKFSDFAKTIREFSSSLLTGANSPLTLAQKYAELQTEYQNNLSLAKAGDSDAMDKFQTLANSLLEASKEYNASGDAYTSDFMSVLQDSKFLAQVADGQVSAQQQQLDALNKQVGSLITINDSVLTVADAIAKLQAAMVAAGYAIDGSHAGGLGYVPFDGYKAELHEGERVLTKSENAAFMSGSLGGGNANAAMVTELQALRQEVAQLRQEQAQQTGAIIGGIYDSNERNADAIVEGTGDAISKSDWKDNKVELV